MQNRKIASIGLILPLLPLSAYACLVLISFASHKLGSVIAADKLILLIIILLTAASVLGTVFSIAALLKSETKLAPIALALNIAVLLIILVLLRNNFLTELRLAS